MIRAAQERGIVPIRVGSATLFGVPMHRRRVMLRSRRRCRRRSRRAGFSSLLAADRIRLPLVLGAEKPEPGLRHRDRCSRDALFLEHQDEKHRPIGRGLSAGRWQYILTAFSDQNPCPRPSNLCIAYLRTARRLCVRITTYIIVSAHGPRTAAAPCGTRRSRLRATRHRLSGRLP
jgi:hypothetical protein